MAPRSYEYRMSTRSNAQNESSRRNVSRINTQGFSPDENFNGDMAPLQSDFRKRKREMIDLTGSSDDEESKKRVVVSSINTMASMPSAMPSSQPGEQGKKDNNKKEEVERRQRNFRKRPPRAYMERLDRVRTQRMFLINRVRTKSEDGTFEEEDLDIAGTTGNVYRVRIKKVPSCTCPDNMKGNQCKHIIYALNNILKVQGELSFQLAFLSTELKEIFAAAPVTPQSQPDDDSPSSFSSAEEPASNRKPIEGDCPVCVMEFNEAKEDIIYCRAACGNNIHRQCFEKWAASKVGQPKCVFCRTSWEGDEKSIRNVDRIARNGVDGGGPIVNEDGYLNVARELGISGVRDVSSYHRPWVRGQYYGEGSYD